MTALAVATIREDYWLANFSKARPLLTTSCEPRYALSSWLLVSLPPFGRCDHEFLFALRVKSLVGNFTVHMSGVIHFLGSGVSAGPNVSVSIQAQQSLGLLRSHAALMALPHHIRDAITFAIGGKRSINGKIPSGATVRGF